MQTSPVHSKGVLRSASALVSLAFVAFVASPVGAQVFELNPVELTGTVRIGDYTITSLRVIATSGQLSSSTPIMTTNGVEVPYESIVQVPADGSAFYRLTISASLESPDGTQFASFLLFDAGGGLVQDGVPAVIDAIFDPASLISATVTANEGELLETVFLQAARTDGLVGTFMTSLDAPAGGAPSLTLLLPVGPNIELQCRGNALMTNGRVGALQPLRIVTVPDGQIDETCVFDVAPPPLMGTISGSVDFEGDSEGSVAVDQYELFLSPRPNQAGESQQQSLFPPFAGPANRAEFQFDDVVEGLYELDARATLEAGDSQFSFQLSNQLNGDGEEIVNTTKCQAYVETEFAFGGLTAPDDYLYPPLQTSESLVELSGGGASIARVDPRDGPFRFIASSGNNWRQTTRFSIGSAQTSLRFEPFALDCLETLTTPTRLLETGRVEIRLRLSEGGVMSFPRVEGVCELRDETSGERIYSFDVSAGGSGSVLVPVGLVFVEAPAGVCDFSASATIGGIRVSFGELTDVEIESGGDIVIEIGAPRIEIASPTFGQIVEAAEIQVTGTATDDVEVVSVEVNGVAATLTSTGNPADPNEVSYAATIPLVFGSNTIDAVATDDAGNTDLVSVTIENTLAPTGDDPPTIEITSPTPGQRFDPFMPFPIEGIASDDVQVVSVITTGGVTDLVPSGNPEDPNEVAFSGSVLVFGTGPFTLTATVRDDAGQETTDTVEVLIAPPPLPCDVNGDLVVDMMDVAAIFAARGSAASGPDDPRDVNGDGLITINDGRLCVLQCTLPRCATND